MHAEVDTLDGVGHGTALAGRYRLEERLQSTETSAFWRAVDQTLDRAVGVRVVVGDTADETLDAARRAAMVEDPRLLRVLDVGTQERDHDGGLTYVISEFVDGASLADLLQDGPLPAEEVRAIVGEAARGLEHARANGLHHRRLAPTSLLRTPDGAIKVAGLAVDAAAEGVDDVSSAQAAREDAVALVALLYAGLTGRWPFGDSGGLLGAPVVVDRPVPPADVVTGVPNDLDTLCSVTFGPNDDGPNDPGELADQLAPWGARRGGARPEAAPSPARPSAAGASAAAGSAVAGTAAASSTAATPTTKSSTGDPAGKGTAGKGTAGKGTAGMGTAAEGSDDDTQAMRPAARFPGRLRAAAAGAAGGAAGRSTDAGGSEGTDTAATTAMPVVPPAPSEPAEAAEEPPRRPARSTGAAGGAAAGAAAAGAAAAGAGAATSGVGRPGWDQTLGGRSGPDPRGADVDEPDPSAGPFDAGSYQASSFGDDSSDGEVEKPRRDQSKIILAVVAVLVAVGLVLAINSLSNIGGEGGPIAQPTDTGVPAEPSETPTETETPPPSETTTPDVPPATIVGVRPFDPTGDGENDETAPRAIDDDPESFWNSSTYTTADFGNLKDGLGMVVALDGVSQVSGVTIDVNGSGGAVELRTTADAAFDGSTVVAEAPEGSGSIEFALEEPVETEYLLLWWTELPETDAGFRIELAQVQVQ